MTLTKEQRLSNDNLIAQAIGIGLYGLLCTSIEEQLRASGEDKEMAFTKIKATLDASLAGLGLNLPDNPMTEVERQRYEADIQRRVGIMLNHAYRTAREKLGLPPEIPSRAH